MRPFAPFRRHAPAPPQVAPLTGEGPFRPVAGEPAIELRGVHKRFGAIEVLRGVSLSVPRSKTCVVFGTSGSGKTVLLKLVAGLLQPEQGQVRVLGADLARLDRTALLEERRQVGVLFQAGALFDSMTVFENVAFPMEERRSFRAEEIERRVWAVLAQVELSEAAERYPGELSGGMVKRVALARALVFDPPVLVFDEPTAGLDPLNTQTVVGLIGRTGHEGPSRRTVLAVVNDIAAAFAIADTLAMLHDGQIAFHGSPEAFRASPHPAVRELLATWNRRDELARRM